MVDGDADAHGHADADGLAGVGVVCWVLGRGVFGTFLFFLFFCLDQDGV